MAEFAYNNTKNASIGHILFKLNCGYRSQAFFEDDANPCSRSCLVQELAQELKNLISISQQNLYYT